MDINHITQPEISLKLSSTQSADQLTGLLFESFFSTTSVLSGSHAFSGGTGEEQFKSFLYPFLAEALVSEVGSLALNTANDTQKE